MVPPGYDPSRAWPLVLALHGAGISHTGPLHLLRPYAEGRGFLVLAVDSADYTWDAIHGSYGPDVVLIDRALRATFDRAAVDPARIVIEGFSDGASYALGLGRANGDLFSRIVAFSPGFIPPSATPDHGQPAIFVSHGRQDPILPIDSTSRRIVPALRADGNDVTYVEFEGLHTGPPDVATTAATWLLR